MLTPCTPKLKQFPGAWPEPPSPEASATSFCDSPYSSAMQATDCPAPTSDLLEDPRRPSSPSEPSRPSGSATQSARKAPPLRIIVPPTEYCPFSTDLTLPITPLSLSTPLSSSCFTFSDTQEIAGQGVSVPPTPGLVLSPCPQDTAVATFPSPTSSQFLLMPPTPHSLNVGNEAAISASPPATPPTNDPVLCESNANKTANPRPWEVSSSTWLSDLGGHTETDRIFRQSLLEIASVDTHSSPTSTPALSPGATSPSSQISSTLANNLPTSLARLPASSPPPLSPYPTSMSSLLSARLALMPTGTDTFPSTFDSLEAWREGVTPGAPRFEEPCSIAHEEVQSPASPGARLIQLVPVTALHSSYHPLPRAPRLSKSQSFIKRAKRFGGRVKQFVSRQTANKYREGMDRDVSFRIVTSQDSENGSVILISAPPPPYDIRPPTPIPPHSPGRREHTRSRTVSEYSSALQGNPLEHAPSSVTESSSRRGGNRSTLRRLSLAAFSTIKRV